ncbi:hypothetical protein SAMN02799633_02351 [Bacillus sp. UNCCL81]|nr:hypothetical protein SAMN02799633_02351 [Bacillus sp. UNCCL81]
MPHGKRATRSGNQQDITYLIDNFFSTTTKPQSTLITLWFCYDLFYYQSSCNQLFKEWDSDDLIFLN